MTWRRRLFIASQFMLTSIVFMGMINAIDAGHSIVACVAAVIACGNAWAIVNQRDYYTEV